jgi:hypothetical protein
VGTGGLSPSMHISLFSTGTQRVVLSEPLPIATAVFYDFTASFEFTA